MKKNFLLLFALFVQPTAAQFVQQHGQLMVKENQLVDQNNRPVVLRGVSFGWHQWWPRFYSAETVEWLATDWQCTVLRAAIGVEPHKAYLDRPDWAKKKLKIVIDAAIAEDIYVIIDWHAHDLHLDEAREFFAEMAQSYGNYPNIIYELFNEPDYESWDEVKAYSIELIQTIRKYDPDNLILIGSPHWDQDIDVVADAPIEGFENLLYTVHFYAATHKQELRDKCDYALSKGIPLFISESAGMEASGDKTINTEEWTIWTNWAETNKISWITWSISDKYETCSMLFPSAASKGNWKAKDLKESGKLTREMLRKHNGTIE